MNRMLALKICLGFVGVLFLLLAWPLEMVFRQQPAVAMMLSLYVTLGVFLLLAIRDPGAHPSLIAFAAWRNGSNLLSWSAAITTGAITNGTNAILYTTLVGESADLTACIHVPCSLQPHPFEILCDEESMLCSA